MSIIKLLSETVRQVKMLDKRIARLETLEFTSSAYSSVGALVYNNTYISIPNATETYLTFNSERYDTDDIHSTVSNTGRLTCQVAGIYVIGFSIKIGYLGTNPLGERYANLVLNRTALIDVDDHQDVLNDPGTDTFLQCVCVKNLVVGDYVEVQVVQESGTTLIVEKISESSPNFWMQRIG